MKVTIHRYDPDADRGPFYQEYDMPEAEASQRTILDILHYLASRQDRTLSYYMHSVCNQGICDRCKVKASGTTVLTCAAVIRSEEPLLLEPAAGRMIKDLVVLEADE